MTSTALAPSPLRTRVRRGLSELMLVLALYGGYSLTRLIADDSPGPAVARAHRILNLERFFGLDIEATVNGWFIDNSTLGLMGSYYYASAHYLVTGVVLIWLWRRGSQVYQPARMALVVATMLALALYLLLPTAPPRFVEGFTDVLRLSAAHGWWSSDASAPKGMGGYTNELAAFPSMHAGWALWVAFVVQLEVRRRWVVVLAWAHAAITSVVIIGTGNHWTLDVVAGWAVVAVALAVVYLPLAAVSTLSALPTLSAAAPERRPNALRTTAGSLVAHIGGKLARRKAP